MKKLIICLLCFFLGGCAYRNPLSDMAFQMTPAMPYMIANWYKLEAPGQPVKIYIEGDGHAFDRQGRPTDNPTPQNTFMRELAAGDPSPNVVYLARPCQYFQGGCTPADWTSDRFSETVIHSMETAVAALMKKARTDHAVLIGFSGGAQIAGWVAVRHPDWVQHLITIAGVLDTEAWTSYHGDTPLTGSKNLKEQQTLFLTLPQTHYAGGKDTVVPPTLIQDFVGADHVIVVPRAGHGTGFSSIYPDIYGVLK